ncbi:MAG TPA: NAD-dependent epimerase/dehydratase family protein [Acidimicrobiales bacterium]|nr:NAD-dependent epimerase/dehydratase family protein [Acidimicrobiales bacterium]
MPVRGPGLTVAVTGPTGTFGSGLLPLLQADQRIHRVVGIARRRFDPAEHGWTKMAYRRGDVRDGAALEEAFGGADVVVHLAFWITGTASRDATRHVNVEGTINAFRAAAAAGVRRFVYASSVAAYGFHADNPVGMTEEWPTRPAARLFYAQEKAELEQALRQESAAQPQLELYVLRPPIVLGPHAVGAKDLLPPALMALAARGTRAARRLPVRLPVPVPAIPIQLIHEEDVGRAFLLCIVAAGPPGTYNIAGGGVVTARDVARELGLSPVPLPTGLAQRAARLMAAVPALPFVPPVTGWVEAASHPAIMDCTKAERELGWRPSYSALEALRSTALR